VPRACAASCAAISRAIPAWSHDGCKERALIHLREPGRNLRPAFGEGGGSAPAICARSSVTNRSARSLRRLGSRSSCSVQITGPRWPRIERVRIFSSAKPARAMPHERSVHCGFSFASGGIRAVDSVEEAGVNGAGECLAVDYWTMAEHMTFWQWLGGEITVPLVLIGLAWLSARIVYRRKRRDRQK
jgi:hypothetical protein